MSVQTTNSLINLNNLEKILIEILERSSRLKRNENPLKSSTFYTIRPISIPLNSYIERLRNFLEFQNNHVLLALKYYERVLKKGSYNYSKISLHKLFFVCLLAAEKYLEDDVYDNSYYSQVAGIKTNNLMELELEFYETIEFELYVNEQEFVDFQTEIHKKTDFIEKHLNNDSIEATKTLGEEVNCA